MPRKDAASNPDTAPTCSCSRVHTAKRHEDYDMMDLAQWEFYVADSETLARLGTTSIGLSKVRRIAEGPVMFSDIKTTVSRYSQQA